MLLGLYGGSFDPVHRGHLLVAQAALEELSLDRLVFIPAAQSPFKPGTHPAPGQQRIRWLRMALSGQTRCHVDPIELDRGGVSFTIDTVRHFRSRFPDSRLFYLIGADQVRLLPQWREAESLATMVEFVVIPRPGAQVVTLPGPFRLRSLRGWPLDVSSSLVRHRLMQGLPVGHLVPDPVAEALRSENAYPGLPC
jgi:nicotinate-nucleotide adenylyltransferase